MMHAKRETEKRRKHVRTAGKKRKVIKDMMVKSEAHEKEDLCLMLMCCVMLE